VSFVHGQSTELRKLRSRIHGTTMVSRDTIIPDGPHITISFKTSRQVQDGTHLTAHGYVTTFSLRNAQFERATMQYHIAKADNSTSAGDKIVWPPENDLQTPSEVYEYKR
jgi:hypothetical protein